MGEKNTWADFLSTVRKLLIFSILIFILFHLLINNNYSILKMINSQPIDQLIPKAVDMATEECVELRESLPTDYLNYMGIVHSEEVCV